MKRGSYMVRLRANKTIGIDLGTSNTITYLKGKGIISNEPSVVAMNKVTGELLAIGKKAEEMLGRIHEKIAVLRPIKEGIIDNFEATKLMLKYFIKQAFKGQPMVKPRVLISCPMEITQVEKRAVLEACRQAGAQDVALIIEPIASALGADLPVEEPRGSMVVNIGGGSYQVAVISLGGIVVGRVLRAGGEALNQVITRGVRRIYNIDIGGHTAEKIKKEAGYAIAPPAKKKYQIKGKNLATGLPAVLEIELEEITEIMQEHLHTLLEAISSTLERTPPELASDILEKGITLTGGGARLKNLDRFLATKGSIPIRLAAEPVECVAQGIGKVLEDPRLYDKIIRNQL
jgi:rod shape-determining protein MreB